MSRVTRTYRFDWIDLLILAGVLVVLFALLGLLIEQRSDRFDEHCTSLGGEVTEIREFGQRGGPTLLCRDDSGRLLEVDAS